MAEYHYDPAEIEPRWQQVWADEGTWEVSNDEAAEGPTSYVLEMLPYPSGEPHIGHLKVYSVGDAVAHFHRRTGRRVLHPMGYDAFGLPAENHAIKTGQHPRDSTDIAIKEFQRQFRRWGVSIDWTREFGTHEPRVYRWTQWIFLQLFKHGLAYQKQAAVNWDPVEETVLANEQVVDGRGERSGALVEVRQLTQWFFRITDYADRLLEDLDAIRWPEHVKTMQRNWIGRSEGAEVVFRNEALGVDYPVFTTRPDTLFGATFFVMAPEHPDVLRLAAGTEHEDEVREYVNRALTADKTERGDVDKEKTGVPLGRTVTNPVNGEPLPMYVADYVLMEYGTGAIMAVPGHDERDFAFAEKFGLPIKRVIADPDDPDGELPYTGDGPLVNSAPEFDGIHNREALRAIVDWLEREGKGHLVGQLPPARLAHLPPALLGHADPDHPLPGLRRGGGARLRAAGRAARGRGLQAARALAAGRGRGLGEDDVPAVRRSRRARDRHDGHVRRLVVVLPALHRRGQRRGRLRPRGRRPLDAGRPVHRRRRARDPAPHVRALLHEGARRPRPPAARDPGAVRGAVHAGDDPARRREDVQEPRQRRIAEDDRRALRRRHRALLHPLHRPARPGRRLVRQRHGGHAPLPRPAVAAERRGRRRAARRPAAGRAERRRRAAHAQGALGDREGHERHERALQLQHGDRRRDGAAQRGDARQARRGLTGRGALRR